MTPAADEAVDTELEAVEVAVWEAEVALAPGADVGPVTATPTEAAGMETAPTPGMETAPEVGTVIATDPETETVAPAEIEVMPTPGIETLATPAAAVSEALGDKHWPFLHVRPNRQTLSSLPQLRLSTRRSTTAPPATVAVAETPAVKSCVLDATALVVLGATHRPF